MVGALWTGISGLGGSQTGLDNESNNIANVNTIGFKASRVSFADQMYQDKIGKGVTSFDIEKMYTQGNLKNTGVSYDMALSGDGFFQVKDGSDTYYTRAGNFRMGEGGSLEDVGQKKVQGWAISTPTDKDITSTDSNAKYFTNEFSKLLGNKVIKDTSSIETIVAKATDYTTTAQTDSKTVFSGAGYKSASTKISDVETLITEYNSALSIYAEADPKPTSSTSSSQKELLNFPLTGSELAEGDEIYAYINGQKYSVPFNKDNATTMKDFTDFVSDFGGFNAYITGDTTSPFDVDTQTAPELGYVILEGLVPGKQFRVTEFGWTDADNNNEASKGDPVTIQQAVLGTGMGHINSIRDALAESVSGKQMDVFTPAELALNKSDTASNVYSYQIDIYDKETNQNIMVPSTPLALEGEESSEISMITFPELDDTMAITLGGVTMENNVDKDKEDAAEIVANASFALITSAATAAFELPTSYTEVDNLNNLDASTKASLAVLETNYTNSPTAATASTLANAMVTAMAVLVANETAEKTAADSLVSTANAVVTTGATTASATSLGLPASPATPAALDALKLENEIATTENAAATAANIAATNALANAVVSGGEDTAAATAASNAATAATAAQTALDTVNALTGASTEAQRYTAYQALAAANLTLKNNNDTLATANAALAAADTALTDAMTAQTNANGAKGLTDTALTDAILYQSEVDATRKAGAENLATDYYNYITKGASVGVLTGVEFSGTATTDWSFSKPDGAILTATNKTVGTNEANFSTISGDTPSNFTYEEIDGSLFGYQAATEELVTKSIKAIAKEINDDPELSKYVEAYNFNGNLVVKTKDSNYDVEFSSDLKAKSSVSEVQNITINGGISGTEIDEELSFLGYTIKNINNSSDSPIGSGNYPYDSPEDIAALIVDPSNLGSYGDGDKVSIIGTWNANNPTREISTIKDKGGGVLEITYVNTEGNVSSISQSSSGSVSFSESVEKQAGRSLGALAKNPNFSTREGAGAEFLQINTNINQNGSKNDLQLRLDTLGLTDSAFGDFEVDDTGLVTMTQDGARFAIGQVAVARFTDNRGLEPVGDNLLMETTRSGTALFNTNNDKMAEIKGGTLELSTADLSESLVNLMVFQRAFEANAKSITTADQILTTLIQLKR